MTGALERNWARVRRRLGSPIDPLEAALTYFGAVRPNGTFLQIGANDGEALDPLRHQIVRKGRWHGTMVEPVPYVFDRLEARYRDNPRISLVRAAISTSGEPLTFYHVRQPEPGEEVWEYYHALGSFRREVVLKHAEYIPDIEDRIVATEVPCLSYREVCELTGLECVDLVQMDTEGYDYQILKGIDFDDERQRPRLILYEHHHLGPDRPAARQMLIDQGYDTFESGLDTAAFDLRRATRADRRLVRLFRTTRDNPTPPLTPQS